MKDLAGFKTPLPVLRVKDLISFKTPSPVIILRCQNIFTPRGGGCDHLCSSIAALLAERFAHDDFI